MALPGTGSPEQTPVLPGLNTPLFEKEPVIAQVLYQQESHDFTNDGGRLSRKLVGKSCLPGLNADRR